jgi:hypothetical protein
VNTKIKLEIFYNQQLFLPELFFFSQQGSEKEILKMTRWKDGK